MNRDLPWKFLKEINGKLRQQHARSNTRTPPMLGRKYMDWNGSAAMLTGKGSAGVAPEVNLRKSLCTDDKAHKRSEGVHHGFETQV